MQHWMTGELDWDVLLPGVCPVTSSSLVELNDGDIAKNKKTRATKGSAKNKKTRATKGSAKNKKSRTTKGSVNLRKPKCPPMNTSPPSNPKKRKFVTQLHSKEESAMASAKLNMGSKTLRIQESESIESETTYDDNGDEGSVYTQGSDGVDDEDLSVGSPMIEEELGNGSPMVEEEQSDIVGDGCPMSEDNIMSGPTTLSFEDADELSDPGQPREDSTPTWEDTTPADTLFSSTTMPPSKLFSTRDGDRGDSRINRIRGPLYGSCSPGQSSEKINSINDGKDSSSNPVESGDNSEDEISSTAPCASDTPNTL